MKVVLISGKQGSGKTTLQKALCHEWTASPRMGDGRAFNFADIIYEMHDKVLAVLHNYWPDRNLVKDGPLLQLLGTQWGRDTIDTDIWVKCMVKKLEVMAQFNVGLAVVGDCRFENEFDAFPDALRVRLYCPESTRKLRCSMWRDNVLHPSEIGLDEYHVKNKFDLVLQTHTMTLEQAVFAVFNKLDLGWMDKRKPQP